jgi:hypothetical protein
MNEQFNSWVKNSLSLAVIPCFVTYFLGFITPRPSPIGKLEYVSSSLNGLIQVLESKSDKFEPRFNKFEMRFKGKSINELSQTDIQIFNRTGKNYKNIQLTFELKPDLAGKVPILVSLPSIVGPKGYDSSLIKLQPIKSQGRFTYIIPAINTSDNILDEFNKYFKISFIAIGNKAPEVMQPMIVEEGLEITKYDTNLLKFKLVQYSIVVLLIYFLVASLASFFIDKRNKNRLIQSGVDKLNKLSQGENASLKLDPEQIPMIVETIINIKWKRNIKDEPEK